MPPNKLLARATMAAKVASVIVVKIEEDKS